MRQLEKMVLINSANMKCEEVLLDGNVHFIGKNGVGKSTLLRAVLFFYSGMTTRLGIAEEVGQKKFMDFYLPNDDSYMVYQVCTEAGPFMIVAYNRQKRIHFRFIDTAYQRSYFLDENNTPFRDWAHIADRLGDKSLLYGPVRTFDEYRNIIYGRGSMDKRLSRFWLFNKSVGRSMPQIMQDVYLNNTLEADEIKKTIIGSADIGVVEIELDRWRGLLSQLKNKIMDVNLWCIKEKDGSVRVRNDAEKLVEVFNSYRDNSFKKKTFCSMLAFVLNREKTNLPLYQAKLEELAGNKDRMARLLAEEENKYRQERDKLVGDKKSLENVLKETERKRTAYENMGIDRILLRMAGEKKWRDEKESLDSQYKILTDKSRDICNKFGDMIKGLDDSLQMAEIRKEKAVLDIRNEYQTLIGKMDMIYRSQKDNLHENLMTASDSHRKEIESIDERLNGLKVKLQSLKHNNPIQQKIQDLQVEIYENRNKEEAVKPRMNEIEKTMTKILHEFEMKEREMRYAQEKKETELENEKKQLYARLKEIDDLLGAWEGSFINWLEENVPDWEENIGRTVLEENVLYNKNLEPEWVGGPRTLFGVRIDCRVLQQNVRTPRILNGEKESCNRRLEELNESLLKSRASFEKELEEERNASKAALKKNEKEWKQLEQECLGFQCSIQSLEGRVRNLMREADEWLSAREQELQTEKDSVEQERRDAMDRWNKKEMKFRKETGELDSRYQKDLKSAMQQKDNDITSLEKQYVAEYEEIQAEKTRLQALMTDELVRDGVDGQVLKDVQDRLKEAQKELLWIEENRKVFFDYNKDKEDFFEKESARRMQRDNLKKSLDSIDSKYEERKRKKTEEKERYIKEYERLKTEYKQSREKIEEVGLYLAGDQCPAEYSPDDELQTEDSLAHVFSSLRQCVEAEVGIKDKLKGTAIRFNRHFSEANTFDFQMKLETEGECLRLAKQVDEFLKGNVIETLKMQVRDFSVGLLGNLYQEVCALNERIENVKKTVNEINDDFRKDRFTDVINLVEMRVEENSNNRLMRQLNSLMKFYDSNRLFLERSLFADEEVVRLANNELVSKLDTFIVELSLNSHIRSLSLAQAFKLSFRVTENGNTSDWLERLKGWGSEGTGIMVKAMINIALLSKHHRKNRNGELENWMHCIMDEIGMIHSSYIKGLLHFANRRNILLVNGSPEHRCCQYYKRTYLVRKDTRNVTTADLLLEKNEKK